ncbi:MAG: hypothetical protein ACR2HA_13955 [Nocardioides sp.]
MSINPFEGTEFAASWQQGVLAVLMAPDIEHSAPLVLEPDQQTAYNEGVLAGQDIAAGGLTLPSVPSASSVFGDYVETVGDVADFANDVREIYKAWRAGGVVAVEGAAMQAITFGFLFLAILGPNRSDPTFDEAALQAVHALRDELASSGLISSGTEFFMAACAQDDHGRSGEDAMRREGWWHGMVFLDFDSATAEEAAHEHFGIIMRFQAATPDVVDILRPQ